MKASLKQRSMEETSETQGRRSGLSPYFRSSDLIEPFHPYWQLPEEQPLSVNGICKPYGLLLGKSNWQFSKRMLVRVEEADDVWMHVAVRNYVCDMTFYLNWVSGYSIAC